MLGRLFYYLVVISLQPLPFAEIVRSSNQYLLQCSKVEVAHWSLWSSEKGYWRGKVFVWNCGLVVDLGKVILHAISENFQYSGLKFFACPSPQPFQHPSANPTQVFSHNVYVVVQNFSWFKFYCLLFHYDTLSYPKTKENKIWAKDKIEPQCICYRSNYIQVKIF